MAARRQVIPVAGGFRTLVRHEVLVKRNHVLERGAQPKSELLR